MTKPKVKYYKILSPDMTPCHGGSGRYYRPVGKRPGKWMPKVDVVPCQTGYHICETADLSRWLRTNGVVWECETDEVVVRHEGTKSVSGRVRLLRPVGALSPDLLRGFAADAAERVLPIFEVRYPDDNRPRLAIEAARSGNASSAAAGAAADAAYASAAASADASASAAASAAAYAAAASAASADYADYAAASASAADYADYAAAAAGIERQWQGERLLLLLSKQKGRK